MAEELKKLKLGVIGLSEGNGHPYSWSAIFNGFNPKFMRECPFPTIPGYLAKEKYPENFIGDLAEVTHVWTQDLQISQHIANSSNISNVVENMVDMIPHIDAVLLARDDAKNHGSMARPFLESGLPIFIDKPFALSLQEAEQMLDAQKKDTQIFTCSSLRYADELKLNNADYEILGNICCVEASIMKTWDTYAIHLLEPIVSQIKNRGKLGSVKPVYKNGIHQTLIEWEKFTAYIKVTGPFPVPLAIKFFGTKGNIVKTFHDSFNCFKKSLRSFVKQVQTEEQIIQRNETLELVKILEWGSC